MREEKMAKGDKSSYTARQKRMADHIEEGYEERCVPAEVAERRAWATVNKETHGGQLSGSGRNTPEDHSSVHKGGKRGGAAQANRSAAARSASAKKAAATRRRNATAQS